MKCNVIKVGGSLLDTSDLTQKLSSLITTLQPSCTVVVVGGGKKVRKMEQIIANILSDSEHWDSLRIMTENAIALKSYFDHAVLTSESIKKIVGLFFLDAHEFCKTDNNPNEEPFLPQTRDVRSDTVALRFAHRFDFSELYLLKSVDFPDAKNWEDASNLLYVDPFFYKLFNSKKKNPTIHAVNMRGSQIIQPFNSSNKI